MNYKIAPWRHQLAAIEEGKNRPHYGLFFEQGCGKSPTLINILRHKYAQHEHVLSTLILCPLIVVENWRREWLAHSEVPATQLFPLLGSQWKRIHDLEHALEQPHPPIVITNYESLNMLALLARFQKWAPEVVALDESQKIKDPSTKRTKRAILIGKTARYKYLLSGTPVINSPFDIFSQFLFMDDGETFSADYRQFRERFFIDHNAHMPRQNYFPDWQPKMGALKAMNGLIYQKAMRVRKKECLDLPPLVEQEVNVELDGDQATAYSEMLKDAVTTVNGATVSADLAIKKCLRLQQIASGFVHDDEHQVRKFKAQPKLQALAELFTQIREDQKIIVWCNYKQNYADIRALCRNMEIYFTEITGEVSTEQKQANVDAFNNNHMVRVLIANPASAGIGVNLVSASYAIFYTMMYSLELYEQAKARNYRGGSERHEAITHINIVAKDTIDEVILTALRSKSDVAETILTYMRNHPYERAYQTNRR